MKLASGLLGVSLKTENSKYKLNLLNLRSAESSAVNAVYADYLRNPYVGIANILTYTRAKHHFNSLQCQACVE